MREIVLTDADRDGETMTAHVIRYDADSGRLELSVPNTAVVFTLHADGARFTEALGGRSFYWEAPRAEPAKKRTKRAGADNVSKR